ncbi:MAG: hypothetical protein ACO1SV_12230 [Fimbriimonas sp.]
MPVNGAIARWGEMEFRVASSGSVSHSGEGVGVGGHSASGNTLFAPNAIDLAPGLILEASASLDVAGVWTWTCFYDGPRAPFGGLIRTGSGDSAEVRVVLDGVLLYSKLTGSLWRFVFGGIRVYCNGVLEIDQAGLDLTSAGVGPNYVPLIGIPLSLAGSCSAGTDGLPAFADDDTYDYQSSASATAEGGWRFKEAGSSTWVSLPVTLPTMGAPSAGGCPFGLSPTGVSASETWGATVSSYSHSRSAKLYVEEQQASAEVSYQCRDDAEPTIVGTFTAACLQPGGGLGPARRDVYKTIGESEGRGGSVRLVPDLSKAVKRMQPGYRCMWYRGPQPFVRASRGRFCSVDGVTSSASDAPELYAAMAELLSVVGDSAHAIEDFLALPTYAPCAASNSKSYSEGYPEIVLTGACQCPPVDLPELPDGCGDYRCDLLWPDKPEPVNESESVSYAFPATVGPVASPQWHDVPLARYLGHQPNPHWHLYYFRADWEVDGSPAPWADYWGPLRQQWLYHGALPGGEQRRTRNHLISGALEQTGHTPWLDEFAGGLRWLGISRWQTQTVAPPAAIALNDDSQPAWSIEDGSATFGGSWIVVDPAAETVKLTLDVGRWDCPPYMLPHICDRVEFDWEATNIAAVRAYAIYADGAKALIGSGSDDHTSAAVENRVPIAPQRRFAGSWAADAGMGVVSDQGSDVSPGGRSLSTLADPERAFAFGLAKGRTLKAIRFEIDVLDTGATANFGYPEFHYAGTHPRLIYESANAAALLWPDGPGVRWGAWLWFDGSSLLNPPATVGPGYKSTVIDWLIFRRVALQGVSHTGGTPNLATELTQLYDAYEGQSVAQVDRESLSFILPSGAGNSIRAALVNTFSEVPPLACFPFRSRSSSTWLPTGDHSQEVWDWAQERSYIVTDDEEGPAHLVAPDTAVWTGVEPGMPAGWAASSHVHAVTNDETGFKIARARNWATVRPFRGWFGLLSYLPDGGSLHLTRGPLGFLLLVIANDEGVRLQRFDLQGNDAEFDVRESESIGTAQVAFGRGGAVVVVYDEEDEEDGWQVWRVVSSDLGETWEEPLALGPGERPAIAIDAANVEYGARWAGEAWRLWRRRTPESDLEDVADICNAAEDGRPGLEASGAPGAPLVFVLDDDGTVRRWISTNQGDTWEEG